MARLYVVWIYFLIVLFFFIFMPIMWLASTWEATYFIAHRSRIVWARVVFFLAHIKIKHLQPFPILPKGNFIVCFNHSSHLDIPLLFLLFSPHTLRFIAKIELTKIPFFGKLFRTIDFGVARENKEDAQRAYKRVEQAIQLGSNVAIAPEGGTSKNPPKLKPFKSGAFRLAVQNNTPIMVVSIMDNWRIMPSNTKAQGWHRCRVIVHTALYPSQFDNDYKKLSEKVATMLQNDLQTIEYG